MEKSCIHLLNTWRKAGGTMNLEVNRLLWLKTRLGPMNVGYLSYVVGFRLEGLSLNLRPLVIYQTCQMRLKLMKHCDRFYFVIDFILYCI